MTSKQRGDELIKKAVDGICDLLKVEDTKTKNLLTLMFNTVRKNGQVEGIEEMEELNI